VAKGVNLGSGGKQPVETDTKIKNVKVINELIDMKEVFVLPERSERR